MAKSKVGTITTTPFSAFLERRDPTLSEKYSQEYLELCLSCEDEALVPWHKEKLGKQSFCFNSNNRYWVWKSERWCVYVSPLVGIQFEVSPECSSEEAWEIWSEYRKKMSKETQISGQN